MRADEFYQSRKADWETLTRLLDRSQRALGSLSPEDVQKMGQLYRAATSDLALAQRDFPRRQVTVFLNHLVGRAHAVIYRSEPMALRRVWRFISTGYPCLFRQTWRFTLAAALMFIIPAIISGVWTAVAPESARWLLPAEVQHLIPIIEDRELWIDIPAQESPYASSFIMQNNIRVSFLAFSSGVTGGVLTLYVLALNGLILGGLTGLTAHYGIGFKLWTFVIGHGVIELSVIFFAGGSGLMMGWALVRPGLLRRRDALMLAARRAIRLLLMGIPLLMIAGAIEGFISPAEGLPWPVKWAVGLGSGALMYGYLLLAGRETTTSSSPSTPNSD
jgi:uncharacterized membrane protein SpoIIM required for sporulation